MIGVLVVIGVTLGVTLVCVGIMAARFTRVKPSPYYSPMHFSDPADEGYWDHEHLDDEGYG